jgi:polyisoprenoid-binding protein YceI
VSLARVQKEEPMQGRRSRNHGSFVALTVALFMGLSLQTSAHAGAEPYEFDPVHSSAIFKVRHFFTQVVGRFDQVEGTVYWDGEAPTQSSVELKIHVASINTSNEKRDEHLRSADFFDTQNHPALTFQSTKIEKGAKEGHFKVHGDLTMRGVTKPVVVDLEVLGFMDTPMGRRGGFLATTTINRQDFGVSWNRTLDTGGVILGDEVQVEFPVEVVKRST